ncbi:MAG TPA: translation elongation factor Ts [Candidatus Paceibacterota bacterium]|nr:translation elongation factor Ts [Candidatus Paceibacterota bacterium]
MSTKVTTELVKELRDATGISVMQCKKALEEADGDMDKALAILKKTSSEIALKKADRQLNSGSVIVKSEGNKTALVALLCETDFVSKNQDFLDLLQKLTDKTFTDGAEKMKESAKEIIDQVIQKTGENIQLGDAYIIEGNVIGNYVHNNKVAVVVSLEGGNQDLAKDIAMHIAAMKPEYITAEEIPTEAKQTMQEVFMKEVENVDKPEEIKKKMLEGKISTYFKEKTLMDQAFIKNPEDTISKLLEKNGAKIKEVKRYSI